MEAYTHIIWDFNGTLYDDVDVCLTCARRLMAAHGLKPIETVDEYRALFGFPIIDYYVRMGFDFSKTPYSELAVEWVAYYNEESRKAHLAPAAKDALEGFRVRGLSQLILSATEKSMLQRQVRELGILSYFDGLLGLSNIHAYSKAEIGKAWKDAHRDAKALLIGDTDHDAEVARKMGIDCILVASGHQSRAQLQACNPLAVIGDLRDILKQF